MIRKIYLLESSELALAPSSELFLTSIIGVIEMFTLNIIKDNIKPNSNKVLPIFIL